MIRTFKALTLLLMIFTKPADASVSIFDEVGYAVGINPVVLWGIALQESTRPGYGPWPWTANIDGRAVYYESKAKALAGIKNAVKSGSAVDVGLMQVNWGYHWREFDDLEQALDPRFNLIVASKILSRYAHYPVEQAIGKYHCPNWSLDWCRARAHAYSNRVLARLNFK